MVRLADGTQRMIRIPDAVLRIRPGRHEACCMRSMRWPTSGTLCSGRSLERARDGTGLLQVELVPLRVEHVDEILALLLHRPKEGRPEPDQSRGFLIDPLAPIVERDL
jgi:hypothetical protein